MFNLLRMDLKRLQKSRSSYVILILSMLVSLIFFMALYIALNPDLQAWMKAHGFIFQVSGMDSTQPAISFIELFHLTYTQNFLAIFIGIAVVLFNCHEHECGFSKNVLSIHVNRFHYILSKSITLSLYALVMMSVCFLEAIILNLCVSSFFIFPSVQDMLLYVGLLYLIAIAFVCMYTALTIWLKSKSGCIGTVIVYATGIWMSIVNPLLGILGWQKILDYTLMSRLGMLSRYVQSIDMNQIFMMIFNVVCFILIYTFLSTLRSYKKDI